MATPEHSQVWARELVLRGFFRIVHHSIPKLSHQSPLDFRFPFSLSQVTLIIPLQQSRSFQIRHMKRNKKR